MTIHYRLVSRIPEIIASLDPETLQGVRDAADEIVVGAKERVAYGPPDVHLRDAIHVEVSGMETRVVAGDDDVYYGHIVEHGGVNHSPHPFLIPAYEAVRPRIEEIIGDQLEDL